MSTKHHTDGTMKEQRRIGERDFTPSPTHPMGDRASRRGGEKVSPIEFRNQQRNRLRRLRALFTGGGK